MGKYYGLQEIWTNSARATNLFCEILTDPKLNFILALEQEALRKTSTKMHS